MYLSQTKRLVSTDLKEFLFLVIPIRGAPCLYFSYHGENLQGWCVCHKSHIQAGFATRQDYGQSQSVFRFERTQILFIHHRLSSSICQRPHFVTRLVLCKLPRFFSLFQHLLTSVTNENFRMLAIF